MKISVADLRSKLNDVTVSNGISSADSEDYIAAIIAHYEEDNFFKGFKGVHGVTDWITQLETMNSKEQVLFESDSVLHLDGLGKQPFYIIMQRFDQICKAASSNGNFTVAIKGEYMSALFYVVRKFANSGFVTILASNGGPQGTVPHGGKTDVFGTNPLAYGIPSSTDPIVFDAATSKKAHGLIGEAQKTGRDLPADTYLDEKGNYTVDPHKAVSIENFGGYKGYAINLLLEILTSAMIGGVAGKTQKDTSELGTWLHVTDPAKFGDKKVFYQQVDRIKSEIVATEPRQGYGKVLYPGQRAYEHTKSVSEQSEIEIEQDKWEQLCKLASGK